MTKETVRYPDSVVDAVEEVVDEGVFESKSEFYRFSAEYVLDAILPDYEPESFDFEEIVTELEEERKLDGDDSLEADAAFLEAALTVRKHSLRGEFDEAEAFIDRTYRTDEVEAVVLEELLGLHRAAEK